MRLLLIFVFIGSYSFAQSRFHIDKVVCPNDSITYLKFDMKPLNGIVYSDDGELGEYVNGLKEGEHKEYENGSLISQIDYKSGIIDGVARYYDGFYKKTIEYKNGVLHGKHLTYYYLGTENVPKTERFYENGKAVGIHRVWWDNGQLASEEDWNDYDLRVKEKVNREWWYNGQLKEIVVKKYIGDTLCVTTSSWSREGIKKATKLKGYAGSKIEIDSSWYPSGQLESAYKSVGRKTHGIGKQWHQNGNLRLEIHFNMGLQDGTEKWWFDDGSLRRHYNYVNGKREGIHREWHYNGQLWVEEYYVNGLHHGTYKKWHMNGRIEFESNWNNGLVLDDKVLFYDENGEIQYTVTFDENGTPICDPERPFEVKYGMWVGKDRKD